MLKTTRREQLSLFMRNLLVKFYREISNARAYDYPPLKSSN